MSQKQKTGYDLDGVLAPIRSSWLLDLVWEMFPRLANFIAHFKLPEPLRYPEEDAVIITGRSGDLLKETEKWLKKYGIKNELYLNTVNKKPDRERSARWKELNINQLGITEYYEDNAEIVKYLRKHTKAKIIKVRNKNERKTVRNSKTNTRVRA